MKMKTPIVLHDVYCDVTYPEYLHVRNRYPSSQINLYCLSAEISKQQRYRNILHV
jgi:hypothetical protein